MPRSSHASIGWLGAGALLAAGCASSARPLTWTVELEAPELRGVITIVRAEIREGGCEGRARYGVDARVGARVPTPPVLSPGRYGFSAEALDASCVRVAGDCQELTLPGPTSVVSHVRDVTDTPVCADGACSGGVCTRPDAGIVETDAGDRDALMPTDAARPDAGACPDAGATISSLRPFLACGSHYVTESVVTDAFEVRSGTLTPISDFFHRDGICGSGCREPVLQLASGTEIRARVAGVSEVSLLAARQMGGGQLTIEVCGHAYFGPASLSASSPDPGFNNLPSEGTAPIAESGECELVIRATGGVVTLRRFDMPCRSVSGPPTVSITVDGAERVTRPGPTSAVLAWTASGASQCEAMGAWSGVQHLEGSLPLLGLCAGTHSYALSCVGPTGETTVDIAEVVVE
ncbi:MAG: hypothetical protein K1X94_35680 [Sandaracinaceae bacterium]|nr:hypothetical protein [Sandaracinaceae bacterium]